MLFWGALLPFLYQIFIFVNSQQDNPEFYEPTTIELQQGTAFAAPKYWGVHVRRSKSLRVAFLGGSQTSGDTGYVNSVYETMKTDMINMNWSFAVYNEGIPGDMPHVSAYKFFKLNTSEWPNVISLEPCLNCVDNDMKLAYLSCSIVLDNVKYFINRRYKDKGLDPPYYFFLEFFVASDSYWGLSSRNSESESESVSVLTALPLNITKAIEISDSPHDRLLYRGSMYAPYMMDMARFYGIPVLSVTDVLYPSWVRFFLTHNENERWPCSEDGYHTIIQCAKLVADHILKPFFLNQMTSRESDKVYESALHFTPYHPVDLHMFSADQYPDVHILGR